MIWHWIRFHRTRRLPVWAKYRWKCSTCGKVGGAR